MPPQEITHPRHKLAALFLAALLTAFLCYAQYTGAWGRMAGWGVRPASMGGHALKK